MMMAFCKYLKQAFELTLITINYVYIQCTHLIAAISIKESKMCHLNFIDFLSKFISMHQLHESHYLNLHPHSLTRILLYIDRDVMFLLLDTYVRNRMYLAQKGIGVIVSSHSFLVPTIEIGGV